MEPPAIFFHPDAVETKGTDLVGRRSAGQSFLRGFLDHMPGDHVNVVTETDQGAKTFTELARELGETRPIQWSTLRGGKFDRAGTIFFPGPGFLNAAWRRLRSGTASCSLVGITHTVSTRRVIEGLHQTLHEPVEDWDAIICTSTAVHSVVARQLELEADYARQRYGATRVPQPQLPIIPLGIRADDFAFDADLRGRIRAEHGAPDDAIVILTVGRWTVVEKANPAPMFLVLEKLAQTLGRPVHLWMAGWAAREEEEKLHADGAAALCPSVTTRMIDGREAVVRRGIWSGADIFTLPVDNIQETFGLVPIEAMAASLPVVMPDWDGFRDTIKHGETGFLVPTRLAASGAGDVLARRFADGTDDYLRFLISVGQHTQIDLAAYFSALDTLARDADLRKQMGQAGVAHVRANYDLAAIIPRYHDLALHLAERRKTAKPTIGRLSPVAASPIEVDPFDLYAAYPSAAMSGDVTAGAGDALDQTRLDLIDRFNGRQQYRRKIVPDDMLFKLHVALVASGPMTASRLSEQTGVHPVPTQAALLFMAKFGFVTLDPVDLRQSGF